MNNRILSTSPPLSQCPTTQKGHLGLRSGLWSIPTSRRSLWRPLWSPPHLHHGRHLVLDLGIVNGFAKDPVVMAVGRALQGMGAGFTVPSALAMLTTTYPVGRERNFALAVFGGTGAAGSVIGVLLGGIFGSTIGKLGHTSFLIQPSRKSTVY